MPCRLPSHTELSARVRPHACLALFLHLAAATALQTGCGARTPLEADGDVSESDEEQTASSSSSTGTTTPSEDACLAAAQAASVASVGDFEAIAAACCEVGCRPILEGDLPNCLSPGEDCVAQPELCTADQYCYRRMTFDYCGAFANNIPISFCRDR
jgi:hypothetical protein